MRQIDVDELKRIQLEILDVVMKFCDENDISCWLNGGTLIGAVRHKGYIPWDDDIDLGMLRPDYDKFIRIFNEKNKRYRFTCIENDPDSYYAYGKVLDTSTIMYEPDERGLKVAVNVDIFVMDNAPDDNKLLKRMFTRQILYRSLHLARVMPPFTPPNGNIIRKICVYLLRIIMNMIPYAVIPKNYFAGKIIANSKQYIHENTERVGNFTGIQRVAIKKSALEETTYAEFEGRRYKIPAGYDEWLRLLYGDYMKLPPVKARTTGHHFKAFIKDEEGE